MTASSGCVGSNLEQAFGGWSVENPIAPGWTSCAHVGRRLAAVLAERIAVRANTYMYVCIITTVSNSESIGEQVSM